MRLPTLLIVATMLVGGCASSPDGVPAEGVLSEGVLSEGVAVTVELPPPLQDRLVGPAQGRVLSDNGALVATFSFESAWDTSTPWQEEPPQRTGAATQLVVELPAPGKYTFELEDIAVSGSPCGTCELGMSGGSVVASVEDGSTVTLSEGEATWIS